MQIKVSAPDILHASIDLPSSKSISNRVLIINALAQGEFIPQNLSDCDDTSVMIKTLNSAENVIDIMAAGTAMRFLTAYLSVSSGDKIITGTKRMQQRPIQILVDALRELGADIEYIGTKGFPPLRIKGSTLSGGDITMKGSVSSQYISALLMIAPLLKDGLRLHLSGEIVSKPYINLTLKLMKDFGANVEWASDGLINVESKSYISRPFVVESDWSAASYWYQMVALSQRAEVELLGLFADSYQGDCKVAEIFEHLGVTTTFTEKGVILRKTAITAKTLDYDFVEQPDLAQTFVVTCALLGMPFRFSGLQSLKIKETDRIAALIKEMSKLGYLLKEENDSVLYWKGEYKMPDVIPAIDTYEDHRMAMAFAPACLKMREIRINNPQVVSKSYPGYWEDLKKAGFCVSEE